MKYSISNETQTDIHSIEHYRIIPSAIVLFPTFSIYCAE